MRIGWGQRRWGASRQWLSHMLLVIMSLRVLVPAGFMLDLSSAADGTLKLIICTASGSFTTTSDASDPDGNDPAASYDLPCAPAAAHAVLTPDLVAVLDRTVMAATAPSGPRVAGLLPPARAGPAHGSRAPPQTS